VQPACRSDDAIVAKELITYRCSIKRYLERVSRCEWMGIHYTPEKAWRDRLSINTLPKQILNILFATELCFRKKLSCQKLKRTSYPGSSSPLLIVGQSCAMYRTIIAYCTIEKLRIVFYLLSSLLTS